MTEPGADAAAGGPHRGPDWSFSFSDGDGDSGAVPTAPGAIVDEFEFAKATLQHELSGVARSSLHLQSLLRRAHRDGMAADELAVYSGLSIETVAAVLDGAPLLDRLFRESPSQ